ncbi:unnamed protein product [Calicophoron daubneyi]|uniref:DUF4806 domain-containing protein n=1 Tax=Calicophoron daubneyi TaxID=300641 RepID=A0AAV2TRJ9_CALDB
MGANIEETQDQWYIVVALPESGGDISIISSTWLQGEGMTKIPNVPPHKFYSAVKNHQPCKDDDEVYHYEEIARSKNFLNARDVELWYSTKGSPRSDSSINLGLSPKRRRLKPRADEEETGRHKAVAPAHPEHDLSTFLQPPTATGQPSTSQNCSQLPTAVIRGTISPCVNSPSETSVPATVTTEYPNSSTLSRGECSQWTEMVKMLQEIRKTVSHINQSCQRMQQGLDQLASERSDAVRSNLESVVIPANNIQQVITLDEKLMDEAFYSELGDICAGIPGTNLENLVRNILCRLINPSTAENIYFSGAKYPFTFKNSRLHGFLLDQVSRRTEFAAVDPNLVGREAKQWLRLRRDRRYYKPPQVGHHEDILERYDSGMLSLLGEDMGWCKTTTCWGLKQEDKQEASERPDCT